jgi:hypothetical protein
VAILTYFAVSPTEKYIEKYETRIYLRNKVNRKRNWSSLSGLMPHRQERVS